MPKISVIIPTYNRETFVTKAIDSILHQTFKDYEIIVIDDGSTDNTHKVLEPYRADIQYVRQENSGVSAARNKGIRLAKGEWVAFLDSDDEWLPEYLSYQMQGVSRNPHVCAHITNSLIIINGNMENNFELFNFLPKFKEDSFITLQRPLCSIIKYHLFGLPCIIIKRKILLNMNLLNIDLRISEDYDLICRLALQGPFGICKEPLVHLYRRDESVQNLSAQRKEQGMYYYKSRISVLEMLRNSEKLTLLEKKMLLNVLSSKRRALANLLIRVGKKKEAIINYKKAFYTYPSIKSLVKYIVSFLPTKVALLFIRKGKDFKA